MNRWIASFVVFTLLLSSCRESSAPPVPTASTPREGALAPAGPLVEGRSKFEVDFNGTKLALFTYKPKNWKGERMLCVMHGVLRNAEEYRDHSIGLGDRFDALVVAPLFDATRFPEPKYQRGGVLNEDGSAAKPEEWTYAWIPRLATAIRRRESKPDLKLWIIGHSAGGQFTMRMSAFQSAGVERFVAVNPGTDLSIFPRHNSVAGDRRIETVVLTRLKTPALVLLACLVFTGTSFPMHQALAEEPPQAQAKAKSKAANPGVSDAVTELTPAQFVKFHALLRPTAKEMRFGAIPWMFDLWEARKKAAALGKPLLILGASGNPCGTC